MLIFLKFHKKFKNGNTTASFARKYENNESSIQEVQKNEETIRHSIMESIVIY
jgi:hypothetical protein